MDKTISVTVVLAIITTITILIVPPLIAPYMVYPELTISHVYIGRGLDFGNSTTLELLEHAVDPTTPNVKFRIKNTGEHAAVLDNFGITIFNEDKNHWVPPSENRNLINQQDIASSPIGKEKIALINIFENPTKNSTIIVKSTPNGATLYLDNINTGQTTDTTLENVPPGEHHLIYNLTGYNDFNVTVNVGPGGIISLDSQLTPLPPPESTFYVSQVYYIELNQSEISNFFASNSYNNRPYSKIIPLDPLFKIDPNQEEMIEFYFIGLNKINYSMEFNFSYDNKVVSSDPVFPALQDT
jgi:hypothetical protein